MKVTQKGTPFTVLLPQQVLGIACLNFNTILFLLNVAPDIALNQMKVPLPSPPNWGRISLLKVWKGNLVLPSPLLSSPSQSQKWWEQNKVGQMKLWHSLGMLPQGNISLRLHFSIWESLLWTTILPSPCRVAELHMGAIALTVAEMRWAVFFTKIQSWQRADLFFFLASHPSLLCYHLEEAEPQPEGAISFPRNQSSWWHLHQCRLAEAIILCSLYQAFTGALCYASL